MLNEDVYKNVDIIVTTFKRPDCLRNLLASIPREVHHKILIGDQEEDLQLDTEATTIQLPYDSGISYSRNSLVKSTANKYILLLEDDFEFTEETNIQKMVELMEMDDTIGVVGGVVKQNGVALSFEMVPTIEDGVLYHKHDGDNWQEHKGIKYKKTGCVMNFALFRKEALEECPWDEFLKLREHQDFYIRFNKTPWQILFTPEVAIKDAKPAHTEEYKKIKNRDEFMVSMMQKHRIHKIKYQNGSCRELKDGKIVKYKEKPLST